MTRNLKPPLFPPTTLTRRTAVLLLLKIRHTAAAASAPDICGRRVLHAQTAAVWKAIKHRESEISYLALSLNIVAEGKEVFFLCPRRSLLCGASYTFEDDLSHSADPLSRHHHLDALNKI